MMAQNDLIVVGIDVAKDKVDACVRSRSLRQTCPSIAQGHRELVSWLRKHQVNKAVMEASGGYERGQGAASGRSGGADCRSQTGPQLRAVSWTAGQERCDRCADDRLV